MAETAIGERTSSAPSLQTLAPGEAWRNSRGSARTLRYVSLLYTAFFFIEPYFQHSTRHWLWFFAFYICFLSLYFAIAATKHMVQRVLVGGMFALAFVYFPFNSSASGAFVYPLVILAFIIRRTDLYVAMVLLTSAGLMLETWLFHLPIWAGLMGVFFAVVIGFSNLAYSRQQQASFMLQRANEEIEHLAQVAERERIARDLHDLLGHTLTVITIKSELANRLMDRDPERARQEMLDVESTARKALQDVREAVTGYRAEGIAAELLRAKRTLESAGVTLQSEVDSDIPPTAVNGVLSLCLREAITNIVRHAEAQHCTVQMRLSGGVATLLVNDDGKGFKGTVGNGLRGMRERVQALGGNMSLVATGNGTRLCVDIPCDIPCRTPTQPRRELHV